MANGTTRFIQVTNVSCKGYLFTPPKQETVTHPLLGQSTRVGLLPHLQARILARAIRGEMESYVPCVLK